MGIRPQCEDAEQVNVNPLARKGLLEEGTVFQTDAGVRVEILRDDLALSWPHVIGSGTERQLVPLVWMPLSRVGSKLGGHRVFFLCPNPWCRRQCCILYRPDGGFFGCRKCSHLAYASHCQQRLRHGRGRAHKVLNQLEARGFDTRAFFRDSRDIDRLRPKGMHRKTFRRLIDEYYACCKRSDAARARANEASRKCKARKAERDRNPAHWYEDYERATLAPRRPAPAPAPRYRAPEPELEEVREHWQPNGFMGGSRRIDDEPQRNRGCWIGGGAKRADRADDRGKPKIRGCFMR